MIYTWDIPEGAYLLRCYVREEALIGCAFLPHYDTKYETRMRQFFHDDITPANTSALQSMSRWLDDYFQGKNSPLPLPVQPWGTPFQLAVYRRLMAIPYGQTASYRDVAQSLSLTAYRAVGSAVGKNPIVIAVPCHRVLQHGGGLGGFSAPGGIDTKRFLLHLEGVL